MQQWLHSNFWALAQSAAIVEWKMKKFFGNLQFWSFNSKDLESVSCKMEKCFGIWRKEEFWSLEKRNVLKFPEKKCFEIWRKEEFRSLEKRNVLEFEEKKSLEAWRLEHLNAPRRPCKRWYENKSFQNIYDR